MAVVSMSNSLTLGASDDLARYYRDRNVAMVQRQNALCYKISTKLREVKEPLKESIPFPELWPYDQPRGFKTFKDRLLTYTHRNWNLSIPWLRWDEEDEVLKGDLQKHLQGHADRFRQLPDQLMVDHMLATATLGQSLGLCFDGAALYSTTNGDGGARFGVTGGNVLTLPMGNEAEFLNALIQVASRMMQFLDTASQPFFNPDEIDFDKFVVCVGPQLWPIAYRAREGKYIYANPNVSGATENVLVGKFDLWKNPRFTSATKCAVFLKHEYYKPFAHIQRTQGPEVILGKADNYMPAMINGEYALMAHTREAVEPFSPHSTCLISTT